MITYLLKATLCLTLLLVFYHIILEREKMHQFNRFYLLGSVIASFIIPLYTIQVEPIIMTDSTEGIEAPLLILNNESPVAEEVNYYLYALYFCISVSLILLFRFLNNVWSIIKKTKTNEKRNYQKAILVLVDDAISPHTFWNYIFINKEEFESKKIEEELFTHELTHATQKHTLDVLLIEFLLILFWFNPIFYLLKKYIQLNHEFLADNKVINLHKNISGYQYLLLNKAAWNNDYYLASNFNYSLTKKRLVMMTTKSSKTKMLLKKLAVIPLITGFTFLFAERVEAQKQEKAPVIKEIKTNDGKIEKVSIHNEIITYTYKNGKKVTKKLSELTEEEKLRLPPPPPPRVIKKKVPSKKLLNDLKNSKKYAIWIDGKPTTNKALNNYKNTDFYHYSGSFVHKNARSKRFPQEYQYSLSTKNYFFKQKKKHKLTKTAWNNNVPPPPPVKDGIIHKEEKSSIPPPPHPTRIVVKKGEKSTIPPPPHPTKRIVKKGEKINIPPPPPVKDGVIHKETDFLSNKSLSNHKYYLDNKAISQKEVSKIKPTEIESVRIKKNKNGKGVIYLQSKKSTSQRIIKKGEKSNIPPPPVKDGVIHKEEKSNLTPPPSFSKIENSLKAPFSSTRITRVIVPNKTNPFAKPLAKTKEQKTE